MSKVLRNLEVPYFSQRENRTVVNIYYKEDIVDSKTKKIIHKSGDLKATYTKAQDSCNITSLAMLLHYFGVTSDTPDEMMRKVFNCFG